MEAATVSYLTTALAARPEPVAAGVRVSAQKTQDPAKQVIVRDDGGGPEGDVRAVCRLGVNVWAPTDEDATALAALVTALLNAWPDGDPVVRSSATRGYAITDEAGPLRYLTAELIIRGMSI
jgi:hypothetical protein